MSDTGSGLFAAAALHRRRSFSLGWVKRTLRLGIKSLWNHRLRSLLTVLGIVFGVCSVIAMLAIGEGASYEAQEQLRQLGSNNIIVRSVKPPETQSNTSERTYVVEYGLTYPDVERIRATIPGVTVIVPARIIRDNVWNGTRRLDCEIIGTMPWYPAMAHHDVAEGRFFSMQELENETNVCVIDRSAAAVLFPLDSPIGRGVRVGQDYYRVIGVMAPHAVSSRADSGAIEALGGSAPAGKDAGVSRMYVPLSTAKTRFGEMLVRMSTGSMSAERVQLHEITVKVADQKDVVETSLIIGDILNRYHKKKDYEVVVPLELLRRAERTKRIFNIVLGAIAAISLVVGGIGIMNIMLASVTERTREIGIRRALGAKRRDIVYQFLVETVLLSATGGLMGVVLGLAIPFFITWFAEMKTIVTLWSPMIAFSISALVGVVFGMYPAFRAASMDPVEALRHE